MYYLIKIILLQLYLTVRKQPLRNSKWLMLLPASLLGIKFGQSQDFYIIEGIIDRDYSTKLCKAFTIFLLVALQFLCQNFTKRCYMQEIFFKKRKSLRRFFSNVSGQSSDQIFAHPINSFKEETLTKAKFFFLPEGLWMFHTAAHTTFDNTVDTLVGQCALLNQ